MRWHTQSLWAVAILLMVATLTTINVPPNVVFNPPPLIRMAMGIAALVLGVIAAVTSRPNPKP